jgi:pyridoxamine 5'-phosphate oxidase-like protein
VDKQLRKRHLAMTAAERDAFLASERTCRIATVGGDFRPHITPMWFVWDGESVWLYSLTASLRWAQLKANPHLAVAVDAGEIYRELRGVEINGVATASGEQPRMGEPCDELASVERVFAAKYLSAPAFRYDGRHAWLRVTPDKIVSWDFRKRPL